jgi:hypothetical protein
MGASMNTAVAVAHAPAHAQARLKQALARAFVALEKLGTRDRLLLAAATLALLVGLELLVTQPLRDKRLGIEAALRDSAANEQLATQRREDLVRQRELDLQQRAQRAHAALAAVGASAAPSESLSFLMSRTLQGLPVQVLSLRALGSEEIVVDTPASAAAPDAAASAPAAATPLYRHRYELRIGGALEELLQAVAQLETRARPLRVERLQLRADAQGALQAVITLVTLGSERTWLAL